MFDKNRFSKGNWRARRNFVFCLCTDSPLVWFKPPSLWLRYLSLLQSSLTMNTNEPRQRFSWWKHLIYETINNGSVIVLFYNLGCYAWLRDYKKCMLRALYFLVQFQDVLNHFRCFPNSSISCKKKGTSKIKGKLQLEIFNWKNWDLCRSK